MGWKPSAIFLCLSVPKNHFLRKLAEENAEDGSIDAMLLPEEEVDPMMVKAKLAASEDMAKITGNELSAYAIIKLFKT